MQLQKGPLGILGWFALKVTGRNPPGFSDSVVPVVEIGDNYLATSELQIQRVAVTVGIGVSSGNNAFVVPSGKIWRLIAAGVFGGTAAADAAFRSVISIALKSPNSGVFEVPIAVSSYDGGNATRGLGYTARPPILLPSGWSISSSIFFSANLTVAANTQMGVVYQEIDQ